MQGSTERDENTNPDISLRDSRRGQELQQNRQESTSDAELRAEEPNNRIFEVELQVKAVFDNIVNPNKNKSTHVGFVPKEGIQVNYGRFGNPVFGNAPIRRAPPLNTQTTAQLEEKYANMNRYKLINAGI